MTEWPWLMITLALISTVQWPNSIAQHTYKYNSFWEGHHRPKRTNSQANQETTSTTTPKNMDSQKADIFEPRSNIRNTNVRILPTSNVTKSLLKNEEYSGNNCNNSNVQPNNGLKSPQTKSASTIIFPNSINEKIQTDSKNKFIPERRIIEKCSLNGSFCLNVDNYPRQDLLHIFRTSKFMSTNFFDVDAASEINDLETRISNTNNLQSFCDSREEVIFPEAGLNKNNEWRYIIQDQNNNNSNFKQGIRVEYCINSGEQSSCKFSDNLPIGYSSMCVQKYIYKKLVAITDSKEIYFENFKLPSCCVCMYSVNPSLLTRKGIEPENRKLFQNQSEPLKKMKDVVNTKTQKSEDFN